jgi:hypothetical protein
METATSVGNFISVLYFSNTQNNGCKHSGTSAYSVISVTVVILDLTMYKADEAKQFSKDAFRNVYCIEMHLPYFYVVPDSITNMNAFPDSCLYIK